jgi:fumarylacetoacetase
MYWSSVQQLTYHLSGGCAMRTRDLLGTGTISGSNPKSMGSLLELTWNGKNPIALNDGTTRTFLKDDDTITLSGSAQGDGFRIGFGFSTGLIKPHSSRT